MRGAVLGLESRPLSPGAGLFGRGRPLCHQGSSSSVQKRMVLDAPGSLKARFRSVHIASPGGGVG